MPNTVSYQVSDTIALRPGNYQLRVSARSAKLAAGGSVYLNLEVPDFTRSRLALSGVAIGYAAGPRVPAAAVLPRRPSGAREPERAPTRALPFAPTLDRVFAATDTLRVYFTVAGRSAVTGTTGQLTILDAGDVTSVRSSTRWTADANGAVDLRVPLEQLTRGGYIMRIEVLNAEDPATREVGFVMR
jgi:hypothetical protein